MKKKMLLPHQGAFIQSPLLFPEKRFHLLVAGYGAGKTSTLASMWAYYCNLLQGKKSMEGHNPRILLGGVTLGHLEKTTLAYIKQDLEHSNTKYYYDKKLNRLTVGNVDTILVSLSAPHDIVGFDCAVSLCVDKKAKIICRKKGSTKPLKRSIMTLAKSFRDYEVFTPLGWRGLSWCGKTGEKELMSLEGLRLTPEHKVWGKTKLMPAGDFAKGDTVWKMSFGYLKKVASCQRMVRSLSTKGLSTEILGRLRALLAGIGLPIVMVVQQRCIGLFGRLVLGRRYRRGIISTTRTLTRAIIGMRTLSAYRQARTLKGILGRGLSWFALNAVESLNTLFETLPSAPGIASLPTSAKTELLDPAISLMGYLTASIQENVLNVGKSSEVTIRKLGSAVKDAETLLPMLMDLLGLTGQRQEPVKSVEKNSRPGLLQKLVPAAIRAKMLNEPRLSEVYDLTVDGRVEKDTKDQLKRLEHSVFYMADRANSIRTTNCDEVDDVQGNDETTYEAVRSVNERTRQVLKDFRKPFLAFCSTAQGQKGLYRVVTNFRKSGVGFVLLRGRTVDNKYLDPEYVESLMQVYTERERRVYLEGYFEALASGRVLGDFDWDKNFVKVDMDKEISDTDLVYWSQDFNCQPGFTKIATDKGFKTMENLSVGDMILTRKGYRKCLTKMAKGMNVVVKTGRTWSTLRHPFITKDGVVDAGDVESYYALSGRGAVVAKAVPKYRQGEKARFVRAANWASKCATAWAFSLREKCGFFSAYRRMVVAKTLQNGRILYGCEKPVWDIEVADAHEYFADGVLVHNSGYHRGCCAILRGNIIYVVKDYEFPDIREAPRVVRNDFPRNKIIWIPDATAKDMIKTFTRELYKHGIFWVMRGKNPNVEDSAFIANKLLWTKRLIFTSAAQDTASDCALAQRDPKTNQIPKGQGRNSPIHRVDTVRMLCFFLTVTQKSLLDIRKATIQRHLDYQEDEPAVTELSDGYAMINPSAL